MKRLVSIGLILLLLLCAAALAETRTVFSDLVYGDAAFQLHLNQQAAELTFDGRTYIFADDCARYREAFMVMGGKTRSIYEQTIPAFRYNTEDAENLLLGTLTIDHRPDMTLYIARGNRESGEYVVSDPIALSGAYTEEIHLPRDEAGNPVVIDQIYLYSYTESGASRCYALSLYIDYESDGPAQIQPYDFELKQSDAGPSAEPTEPEDPSVRLARSALSAAGKPFNDSLRAFHVGYAPLSALEQTAGLSARMLNLPAAGEVFAFFDGAEAVVVFTNSDGTVVKVMDYQANLEAGEMLELLTRDASGSYIPATENSVPLLAELQWIEKICGLPSPGILSHAPLNVWHELPADTVSAIR